jgi:protein SCO1
MGGKAQVRARSMPARCLPGILLGALAALVGPQPAGADPQVAAPGISAAASGISGHFALDATDGRKVTDATYRGKWLVVYFGYTSCPDICPTVILRMGQALDCLGALADRIQPIFITVDPARDTPQRLAQYMASFDPRVVGLRGDPRETREAARQFHVYYRMRSLGEGEYSVDHSSFLYVINPEGQFSKLLADSLSADRLAAQLIALTRQEQPHEVRR